MERLAYHIERFLRAGEGDFESWALALFAHQFERNKPYQAFCRAQGKTPETVREWTGIPAVSIRAFKSADLVTFPTGRAAAIFHSSATTGKAPSRHFFKTLSFYETSLKSSFAKWMINEGRRSLALLVPSPAEAPHSSLTWMLDVVKRQWGTPESAYFIERGILEEDRLDRWLAQAQIAGKPVALLGTTLAFLKYFDHGLASTKTFHLPADSRVMDTGGMKTQAREVSREQFLAGVEKYLGLPDAQCINEYGMCELSSQFYARGASPVFQGPPWVRVQAIDAETGDPVPAGRPGLLRYYDLANVDSVMAIQTDDVGELRDGGFVFKGRAPGAEPKGCSLSAEATLK